MKLFDANLHDLWTRTERRQGTQYITGIYSGLTAPNPICPIPRSTNPAVLGTAGRRPMSERRTSATQFTSVAAPTTKIVSYADSITGSGAFLSDKAKLTFVSTGTTVQGEIAKTVPTGTASTSGDDDDKSSFLGELLQTTGDGQCDKLVLAAAAVASASASTAQRPRRFDAGSRNTAQRSEVMTNMGSFDEPQCRGHSSSLFEQLEEAKRKAAEEDPNTLSGTALIDALALAPDEADFLEDERQRELQLRRNIEAMDSRELKALYTARYAMAWL